MNTFLDFKYILLQVNIVFQIRFEVTIETWKEIGQNRPWRTRGAGEVKLCSFFNISARWGWVAGQLHGLVALPPRKETLYQLYRQLGGP